MYRIFVACGIALYSCILLVGCSSPENRYKAEYKKGLKALNDLYFGYAKGVKAKENAGQSLTQQVIATITGEIKEVAEPLEEIKKRIDDAEPQDEQIKEKVLKRYSPMLESILTNIETKKAKLGIPVKTAEDVCKLFESLTRPEKDKDKKKNP